MTEIFFHIGLYKTATTWFQKQLFPSLDGVQVIRTKYVDRIAAHLTNAVAPVNGSPTIIVSHESLGGTISHRRPPGTARARLVKNLALIAALAPRGSIIVGFREHASWLRSAFSQKAKKNFRLEQEGYAKAFSLEDLSWCRTLETVEGSFQSVFPFLYEELLESPEALVNDLCQFIGKPPPPNLDELLRNRENITPRSPVGQLVSRSILKIPSASRRKQWKEPAYKLGAWIDCFFPTRPFVLEPELAETLKHDWDALLSRIGERRGRDFSSICKM